MKGKKVEPISLKDAPSAYVSTSNEINKDDKGLYKLRARNDRIQSELSDYCRDINTKLLVNKVGDRVFYTMEGMGISVCLINT